MREPRRRRKGWIEDGRRNRGMKYLQYVLSAILAAVVLEWIQITTQPGVIRYAPTEELRAEETVLIPESVYGYEQTENGLLNVTPDPQIYYSTAGIGPVQYVNIYYFKKVSFPLQIQVFYDDGSGLSEINSVKAVSSIGEDFRTVEIPKGDYQRIRIDLDADTIPLDSVSVGNCPPEILKVRTGMRFSRILTVSAALFFLLGLMGYIRFGQRAAARIRTVCVSLREDPGDSVRKLFLFLLFAAGASAATCFYLCIGLNKEVTAPAAVMSVLTGVSAAALLTFRKTLGKKPEYLFALLLLCMGFLLCYYVPHTGFNGMDEDTHYEKALISSYVDETHMTAQDEVIISRAVPASWDLKGGVEAVHAAQDELSRDSIKVLYETVGIRFITESFNGLGLFLGRALGLRYYLIHFLGRFTGLLTYAILGFLAIRKLKSGKMIAAAVLLIPTNVFLASSYNYDIYLTGFTVLGLSYYIAQWQRGDEPVRAFDAFVMIASIAVGCFSKPVYIPLLWIITLLPGKKFPDPRSHRRFWGCIVFATLVVIGNYALPVLTNHYAVGDTRGGEGVDAAGQVRFILSHPLEFWYALKAYMQQEYFNLHKAGRILTSYAYHGTMPNEYVYLALVLVAAFTDKNESDRFMVHRGWAHIWPLLVSFGVTLLVLGSMYITFTPVGADYVNGAQFRYLIPMFFPVLLHIGSGKVQNGMDRAWYNLLILSVAAYVNYTCIYTAIISKYF